MAAPSNKQETQHNNSVLVDDQSNSSASIITQDNCVAPWKHTGCYLPPPPSSQQQQQQQQQVECSLQTTSNSSLDTNEYAGGASTTSAWCAATSTNVPHSWQDVTLITHQPPPGFVLHSLSYQSSVVQATGGDHEVGEIGIGGLSHLKSHGLRSADGEENDETRLKMFSAVNEEQEERMQYQFVAGDDTTAPHPAGAAEPPTNYGFNNYFSQMINSAYADESDRNELHGTTNILDFNLNSCSNNNIEMMALDGEEGNLVPSQAADFYASQQYHQLSLDYNSDANIARNGYVQVDAGYNMMHDYASLVVSPAASLFEATCNEHKMHYPAHFASQSGLSPSKLPLRKRNRNANATAELDCNLQPPKRSLSRGSIDSDCMNKSNRTINATCDNITNGKDLQVGAPQKYYEEGGASTNTKRPRARQGVANDPQSVAARLRRERISERLKVLQQLVPNGSKVDLVTMLEKAISYVKFLQLQLKVLTNDEYWPTETSLNKEGVKIEEAFNAKTGEEDSTFPEIIITLKKEEDALINSEEQ